MKRNIFKALAVIAALALSSCSMFNTDKKDDVGTDTKEAYITIGLNQAGRTALPEVSDADDFDSFTLSGMIKSATGQVGLGVTLQEYGKWSTDATSTAYTKMTAAKIAIKSGETYNFILTATKGGAIWAAGIEKTIETGENSLSFTLELAKLFDEGKGSLDVTLSVPSVVKAVDAELLTIDLEYSVTPSDAELIFANGKATYTARDIPAGNYVLVYSLYGDTEKTLKLGEWYEYAGIANGLKSSSNPVIESEDDLANIYKITLNTNGGTINGTFPGSYTRYGNPIKLPYNAFRYDSDGKLVTPEDPNVEGPIFSCKNYIFEGWFDKETGGNKVEVISQNLIKHVSNGESKEIKLYARWTDTFTVDVDSYDTVDAFGEYLSNSLGALQQNGFDSIKLKLTNMSDKDLEEGVEIPDDWSTIDFQSPDVMDYMDTRFSVIFNAICDVQGDITIDEDENGDREFTYSGLGINLDLSETSLTYLPYGAFLDMHASGPENMRFPVNLIGITLPETLTALLPATFISPGFTEITIPKNVTYFYLSFTMTQGLTVNFETGSCLEELDEIATDEELVAITIPASVKTISDDAFSGQPNLGKINFLGTKEQWKTVKRGISWHSGVPATTVTCSDGVADIDYGTSTIAVANCTNGSVKANHAKATVGKEITLTITPADGYILDTISATAGDEAVELSGAGNTRTFIMPTNEVSITASFINSDITISADKLSTLKDELLKRKNGGFTTSTVKITGMEDAKDPMDWSKIEVEGMETLMGYADERFTTIVDAICAVEELELLGIDSETGFVKYTYKGGLKIKLDLSETSLTYLPFAAFADISSNKKPLLNLIDVTLPQNLNALLPNTFVYPGFSEITIPKDVTYMCSPFMANQPMTINFENGSNISIIDMIGDELCPLNKITIPASVIKIKEMAFAGSDLNEISFESGSHLEKIGDNAFEACNIETITLPASLKSIGDTVFYACNKLATINFEGTKEQWGLVKRGTDWHHGVPATTVTCKDGTVDLDFCYVGTKGPSAEKEVGDIVFNDGSAMPYEEFAALNDDMKNSIKTSSIAVIFYSGTDLNSPDAEGNIDNNTIRTLGVGLKHSEEKLKWYKEGTGGAYDYDIDTIRCLPDDGFSVGHIEFTGNQDKNGSDNFEQISLWLSKNQKYYVYTTNDPEQYFPAFYFAQNYKVHKIGSEESSRILVGSDYENGWYLPSFAELVEIWKNRETVDTASNALGGDEFGIKAYFSSSQNNHYATCVNYLTFNNGEYRIEGKDDKNYVCAIREF